MNNGDIWVAEANALLVQGAEQAAEDTPSDADENERRRSEPQPHPFPSSNPSPQYTPLPSH